jgi:hypothetical protein
VSRLGKVGVVAAAAVIAAGLVLGLVGLGHAVRSPATPVVLAPTGRVQKSKTPDPATLCLRLFDASDAAPADPAVIRALATPALAAQLLRADATRPPHYRGPAAKVLVSQTGGHTAELIAPDFELSCTVDHGKVTALGVAK